MWQDLRHAVRILKQHPGFVCLSALVLALGIGLNTAVFSVVDSMLFKTLPVESPDNLVSIYQVFPRQPDRPAVLNSLQYQFLKEHNEAFSDITAHWGIRYALRADGETDVINAEWVLSNYFDVLGVAAWRGRPLSQSEDDVSNPERAVVISHALWTRRFRSDPQIIGKQIHLAFWDQPEIACTIVGVMNPGFRGVSAPWQPTQLWITMAQGRERSERGFAAGAIGRLRPGVGIEQARAIIAAQARQFYQSRPSARPEYEPRLVAYRTNDVRVPSDPSAAVIPTRLAAAMTVVVATVLLVAAANVAGILRVRGVGRSSEIAVRRVLGAAPVRIVRQLVAEGLLLSAAGAVLGIVLAGWLLSLFRALTPMQFAVDVVIDGRVVVFATATCVIAGLAVAVLPARQATSLDVLPWLVGSSAGGTKPLHGRFRHAVTVPQVASSLMLLLVAAINVRALVEVELAELGYQPQNVLVATPLLRIQPGERTSEDRPDAQRDERYAERSRRFYAELVSRLWNVPGIQAAAIADALPLREPAERPDWSVVSEDGFRLNDRLGLGAERVSVSPRYFHAMGMTLMAGRDFEERDIRETQRVAVVSADLAQHLWPGREALGRRLAMMNEWGQKDRIEWHEVVGVVNDVRPILHERPARPLVYFPLAQQWRPSNSYVLVRGSGDSRVLIPAVKNAVANADARADVRRVQTMSGMIGDILYPRRVAAAVLGASAIVALLLATLGVYGVVSYSVAQRTGEIGVRMALGAARSDITRLVLREGGIVAAVGSAAGLLLGYMATHMTSSTYLALPQFDIATLVVVPLILTAVVLLACYVPARTAARLHPLDVLRRL